MAEHVCPWWLGYWLASPMRRWMLNPEELLGPYVRRGMTVLEPGPGMGFFTLPMARLVGAAGRVVAVDIQPKMLESLLRRASKAGLDQQVEARLAQPGSLGVDDLAAKVDFALAFAVVHETPAPDAFFREVAVALKQDGQLLFAEPAGRLKAAKFASEMYAARQAGLQKLERIEIRHNQAALFTKLPV